MTNHPDTPPGTPRADGVPGALNAIRREIVELTRTMWAARRPTELMDTAAGIESLRSSLDALELDVLTELEATNAVKSLGWASTQDFVTAVAGGHQGAGSGLLKLAKAVQTPLFAPVGEAMADGWLSTTKAQVIRRVVEDLPGNTDIREQGVQVMLEAAKSLDATGLANPDGSSSVVEILMTRNEWDLMVTIPHGDFDLAAQAVRSTLLGLRDDERFLIFGDYELVPSTAPTLPIDPEDALMEELARQHPEGFGRWVVEDSEGNVVDEFRPPAD